MFNLNITEMITGKGLEGIDLSQLPQMVKELENLLALGKSQLPNLVKWLNDKYKPEKGNILTVNFMPTNSKVFLYVKEFSMIDNKEVCVKTHYKCELFEVIETLKKYLPNAPK